MKICILTQPLNTNYGGLLQAFALQKILKHMGHEVWTEDRYPNRDILSFTKSFMKKILSLLPFYHQKITLYNLTKKEQSVIRQNTDVFIHKYIRTTVPICTNNKSCLKQYNFDFYIVGSDQVWRPRYSVNLKNYFLDFVQNDTVKRISYAASFGTSDWEFNEKETKECSILAKKFNAISVRELSGVTLCNKYLKVDAVHVLDPTMLLNKEDYEELVIKESEPPSKGNLFCYMLDDTNRKEDIIHKIALDSGLIPFKVMPKLKITLENVHDHLSDCVFPSVTQWLRAFMDAEMVLTDSFHGCVFSIIFNKPFWVIGNKSRGLARFSSLLSLYDLQSRLLTEDKIFSIDWNEKIDWSHVNKIRCDLKHKSIAFLNDNLKEY